MPKAKTKKRRLTLTGPQEAARTGSQGPWAARTAPLAGEQGRGEPRAREEGRAGPQEAAAARTTCGGRALRPKDILALGAPLAGAARPGGHRCHVAPCSLLLGRPGGGRRGVCRHGERLAGRPGRRRPVLHGLRGAGDPARLPAAIPSRAPLAARCSVTRPPGRIYSSAAAPLSRRIFTGAARQPLAGGCQGDCRRRGSALTVIAQASAVRRNGGRGLRRAVPAGSRPVSEVNFSLVSVMRLNRRSPVPLFRRPRRAPARELSPLAMFQAGHAEWPGPEVTPLELYGARTVPDFSGWWVYAFQDRGGLVWRVGQSSRLWSRWRDYFYDYGERFTASVKWLIPVANEAEADLIELVLIHFYQPECNTKGRREDLEAKVRAWGRGTRQYKRGPGWTERLDQSQAES